MNNYFGAMLRYFEFGGRSSRRETLWFTLGFFVLLVAAAWVDLKVLHYRVPLSREEMELTPAVAFVIFTHFIPKITLTVRRLHDAGKSGWWYWISLIPLLGTFWLLYLVLIKGPDENSDKYGPDPRDPGFFEPAPMRLERHQPLSRAQLMVQQMEERRRRMA